MSVLVNWKLELNYKSSSPRRRKVEEWSYLYGIPSEFHGSRNKTFTPVVKVIYAQSL